ncbi:hypothetical protein, partial [Methylosinus sp. KRF6]|uniref:hypothetical protein n=1 Tax=Methylosinus sp. KRF6 TaxID=2846853 RepID=UPI001C0E877C
AIGRTLIDAGGIFQGHVKQKAGWSSIPAAIPTYMGIREVQKRAVEFILNLDVHKLELERQRLAEQIDQNARDWRNLWDEMDRFARRSAARVDTLPQKPTVNSEELARGHVMIANKAEWVALSDLLKSLRGRIADLAAIAVPEVGISADGLAQQLEALNLEVGEINKTRIEVFQAKQLKDTDVASLRRRIESISDDLQKNLDVQKLERYAGIGGSLAPDHCPTCHQALVDTLLSQDVITAVMPIEANIEYLRSQLRMFEGILRREQEDLRRLELRAAEGDRELNELYSRIRTVRADLMAPNSNPSAVAIEERVRAEARVRELENIQEVFDDTVERMTVLAATLERLLSARSALPKDKMSPLDKEKLEALTKLLQRQAGEYGFSTFDSNELTIDDNTYRPQKEGYEIGFETSASDAIRLKWAYQLGLLELGHTYPTNHPGMLLFDEPRQQSSSKVSFGRLLEHAAACHRSDQQVIVSTSEDILTLTAILSHIPCTQTIFSGYVIKPIEAE